MCNSGVRRHVAQTGALILSVLTLSVLLGFLACTTVSASVPPGSFILPNYTGPCKLLAEGSGDNAKPCVRALQETLKILLGKKSQATLNADGADNVSPAKLEVSGIYDSQTRQLVVAFQDMQGLKPVDGKVGPQTAGALDAAWRILRAENAKGQASHPSKKSAATESAPPVHDPQGNPLVITLSDIIAIGIFVLALVGMLAFGRRLKRAHFNIKISWTSGIDIGGGIERFPDIGQRTLEVYERSISALSEATNAAREVADAARGVSEDLHRMSLERNAVKWRIARIIGVRREIADRPERKMIEGRVENDK